MEKIIVTGGAGFIGSHIVDALVGAGYEVHIVDDLSAGKKENINTKAILHVVDIRDKEKLIPIFKDAKYVFHEAAMPRVQYSIENPIETNEINVTGLLNVLEASRINKVKKVIFASSAAVYGNQEKLPQNEEMQVFPLSPYAVHKYIGETGSGNWMISPGTTANFTATVTLTDKGSVNPELYRGYLGAVNYNTDGTGTFGTSFGYNLGSINPVVSGFVQVY